ncbi:hypothetical protein BH09SUM1_BH09SUM1_06130 [soil metagenome]
MESRAKNIERAGAAFLLAAIVAAYAATWFLFTPPSVADCVVTTTLSAIFAVFGILAPRRGLYALLLWLPLSDNLNVLTITGYFSPALLALLPLFAGWLARVIVRREEAPCSDGVLTASTAVWVVAAVGSAIVTMARYSNGWLPWLDPAGITTINVLSESNDNMIRTVFAATCVLVAGPLLAMMATALLRGTDRQRTACWMLMAGLAVSAVYGRWQAQLNIAFGNPTHFAVRNQANSTFLDPNALGAWCFMALPLAAGLFILDRNALKRTLLIAIGIGTLLMLGASGSRTGLLGVMIATAFVGGALGARWWRSSNTPRHRILRIVALAGCGLAAVAVILFFFVGPGAQTSIGLRLQTTVEQISKEGFAGALVADRWILWSRSAEVTAQFPVGGIGVGAYWMEIPNFMDAFSIEGFYRDNAANWFLQVSAELGIAGLLIGCWLMGQVAFRSARRLREIALGTAEPDLRFFAAAGVLTMIAVFITGPHTNAAQVQLLFWFLIALVCMRDEMKGQQQRARGRATILIAGAILVAIMLAAQLRASYGKLELHQRKALLAMEESAGFFAWGKNTNGEYIRWAGVDSWVMAPAGRRLGYSLYVGHPDASRENPVRIDVMLDNKPLRTELFTAPGQRVDFVFDTPPNDGRPIRFAMKVSRAFTPSKFDPSSTDNRELGVLVTPFRDARTEQVTPAN